MLGEVRDYFWPSLCFFVNWLGPFDLDDETKLRHQVVTSCTYSRYMLKHVLFLTLFCPSLLLFLKIDGKIPFAPLFHSLSTHFSGHFCLENEFLPPFIGAGLANGSTQEGICRTVLGSDVVAEMLSQQGSCPPLLSVIKRQICNEENLPLHSQRE